MKLNQICEDYRSGPHVFPTDALEREQSYKGPVDYFPKKKRKKKKKKKK
jgi:hypothetical protein